MESLSWGLFLQVFTSLKVSLYIDKISEKFFSFLLEPAVLSDLRPDFCSSLMAPYHRQVCFCLSVDNRCCVCLQSQGVWVHS